MTANTGLPSLSAETPQSQSWYIANSQTTNQIKGWYYDCAGNVTGIPLNQGTTTCGTTPPTTQMVRTAIYDAENRMTSETSYNGSTATTTTYVYDGNGHRVSKSVAGAPATTYVYDAAGNMTAEYGTPTDSLTGTMYVTADHLGSTRVMTDSAGAAKSCYDYLPFGGQLTAGIDGRSTPCFASPADAFNIKFTGKERDAESGLDYFLARYYSGSEGRFTNPDPVGANLIRILNPQRWNKYAYVINNPLVFTDPSGKDAIAVGFKTLAAGAGHAAVISVHPDGSATFGSYGPRGGGKPVWAGEYVVQPLQTKVSFGSDGTPTSGSFSVLAGEVADVENVDPSSVDMDYFKTSDAETAALDHYLDSVNGTKSLYVVGVHDCIFVCNTALGRAGIGKSSDFFDIPRWVIWNFGFIADSTYSGESGRKKQNDRKRDKPDVHGTIHFCTSENDSSCKQ